MKTFFGLRRTLTLKFVLLLVGFLVLQAVQLGIGIFGVLQIGNDGAHINQIGKQRARTLLMGNMVRHAVNTGSWQAEEYARFEAILDEYAAFFRMPLRLQDSTDSLSYLQLHQETQAVWEKELRPLLAAAARVSAPAARAALVRYEALASEQMWRFDSMVALEEQNVRRQSLLLAVFQAVVLGITLLLGIVGMLMARLVVNRPLRHLIDAAQDITAGAYDRRIAVSSHDEIGELGATFNQMVAAIESKTRRIMALNQVAVAITTSLSVREIVDQTLSQGISLSGMQAVSIAFYDEESGKFIEWFARGLSEHFQSRMSFSPGGLADQVFSGNEPVVCSDHPQAAHRLSALARDEGIRSYLCLPLLSHASRLGVLFFYRTDSDVFSPEEAHLLSAFARLAAQSIENARLHAHSEEMAITDALTGLRNRRWLSERLHEEVNRSQRFDKSLSILMLDIDHFKHVNDQYGHPAGDAVLKRLGTLLTGQLREVDFAARYGGEEFVLMLPETDESGARFSAERIRQKVANTPFDLPDGRKISVTVSVGVVSFPASAASAQELIARSDQALYAAKQSGRNAVVLYRDLLGNQIEKDPNRIVELLREGPGNIQPLLSAVAAKAMFYRGHTEEVERCVQQLAAALKLSSADSETLRLASRLHDIGVAVIPDGILNKTTPLSPGEWQQVRQHPATAAQFLEQVPELSRLAPIVRQHHERWDGSGYPDGLKGEEINYLARVLAIADAYASMTSSWLGKRKESPAQAAEEIRAGAGTQFDPQIAEVFVQMLEKN